MSCKMTRDDAARLYSILDETIGVFRMEDMSEGAVRFYETKKEEFLEFFSTEIPESYWFQGQYCTSASLDFNSIDGLHVINTSNDRESEKLIEEVVNPALKAEEFAIEVASLEVVLD
jgi:hypothetical protein